MKQFQFFFSFTVTKAICKNSEIEQIGAEKLVLSCIGSYKKAKIYHFCN